MYNLHREMTVNVLYPNVVLSALSRCYASILEKEHQCRNNNNDRKSTNENTKTNLDEFTQDFLNNRIELTTFQKIFLSCGSTIAALLDPTRHDMIACLGETTGEQALINIFRKMQSSEEGQLILKERPRINTRTIDVKRLKQLPDNTFGHAYVKFLDDNASADSVSSHKQIFQMFPIFRDFLVIKTMIMTANQVTPDSRMPVRFMSDPELAYIMTRYRECHDLVHTVLDMPTNMLGEVAVKWFEALNNGLPMCYGAAIFGAVRLKTKQRGQYLHYYLPWAIENGKTAEPLMPVYWEKYWNEDIHELRKQLKITPLYLNTRINITSA